MGGFYTITYDDWEILGILSSKRLIQTKTEHVRRQRSYHSKTNRALRAKRNAKYWCDVNDPGCAETWNSQAWGRKHSCDACKLYHCCKNCMKSHVCQSEANSAQLVPIFVRAQELVQSFLSDNAGLTTKVTSNFIEFLVSSISSLDNAQFIGWLQERLRQIPEEVITETLDYIIALDATGGLEDIALWIVQKIGVRTIKEAIVNAVPEVLPSATQYITSVLESTYKWVSDKEFVPKSNPSKYIVTKKSCPCKKESGGVMSALFGGKKTCSKCKNAGYVITAVRNENYVDENERRGHAEIRVPTNIANVERIVAARYGAYSSNQKLDFWKRKEIPVSSHTIDVTEALRSIHLRNGTIPLEGENMDDLFGNPCYGEKTLFVTYIKEIEN